MTETEPAGMDLIHSLRALTVDLDLLAARFAASTSMNATDVRALIGLLDRERTGEPATPGWLADHLRITTASVTALLDRMEVADLVSRERDPDDRRRVLLSVTETAREAGRRHFGELIGKGLSVVDEFDDAELDVVRRFLGRMREVAAESE